MAKVKKKLKAVGAKKGKVKRKLKEKSLPSLREWLAEQGAEGLEKLEVRALHEGLDSPQGVFLTKDVAKDEVILRVPEGCLLDAEKALKDEVLCKAREQLQYWKSDVSMAFFVCLRLLRATQRSDPWCSLATLCTLNTAGAGRWSEAFQSMMAKTSLKEQLDASQRELKSWHSRVQRLVKGGFDCDFTPESLSLARDFWYANSWSGKVLPWYSWLIQPASANVSLTDAYNLVALTPMKAGCQLSLDASLDNTQLLLRHGVVLSENLKDEIQLKTPQRTISLSRLGIPGQVVDQIEEEQNTQLFVSILKTTLEQRRSVKESLKVLPQALNFTVCKGALQRRRKQYLESFLEGQLAILQATLEQMQDAEEQAEDADEVQDEEAMGEEAESPDEEVCHPRKRRRRRR